MEAEMQAQKTQMENDLRAAQNQQAKLQQNEAPAGFMPPPMQAQYPSMG